ncbi:MAG: hypothetical protein ABIT04_13045 [Novosphingobium sp.]
MNSIDMTIPDEAVRARMEDASGLGFTRFDGRLHRGDGWVGAVTHLQDGLYLLSLAVLVAACCWPAAPARLRVFLLMILAGIAVNALVCGGISQPATRYGSRVIWLLPALAVVASTMLLARRSRSNTGTVALASGEPA